MAGMTKQHAVLMCFSLLAILLVLISTSLYGAGLSPDSVHYIAVARNLAAGAGVVSYNGEPFVVQPPLYPLLLSIVATFVRADPLAIAAFVNALLFGAIVYLAGLLFSKYLSSFALVLVGIALVLLAPAMIQVSIMAWSEPLFICLTLVFLLAQQKFLAERDTKSIVLFIVATALACLTRYIGVTLILTGALALVLLLRERWQVKARYVFLFCIFSALPLALWVTRNYFAASTFLGPRVSSASSFGQNISYTVRTVLSWYFVQAILTQRILFVLIIAGLCGAALFEMARNVSRLRDFLGRVGGIILFIVVYMAVLILSATTTAFDSINDRLLSPIFIPSLLFVLMFLEYLYRALHKNTSKKFVAAIPIALVVLWLLVNSLNATFNGMNVRMQKGAGEYSRKLWRESPLIAFLRAHPLDASRVKYTNAPEALYLFLNQPSLTSPPKTAYNSNLQLNELGRLVETWKVEDGSYLVWFNNSPRTYLFTVDELQTVVDLREVVRLNDGAVFEISHRVPANDK